MDRARRIRAGPCHLDQGTCRDSAHGHCLRRILGSCAAPSISPLRSRRAGAADCRGRRFVVVPRGGTGQTRFHPLLFFRAPRARLPDELAATRRRALVVLLANLARGRAALGRVSAGAAARYAGASTPQRAADHRRHRPPSGTFVRLLVHRLYVVSHGVPLETDYLYLASLSGRGYPGRNRLGANGRRIGVGRGTAADGRGRLVHVSDRADSVAGYFRHNSDCGADAVFIVGVGRSDLCGAHFAGRCSGAWARPVARLTVGLAAATVCCQMTVLLCFAFPQTAEALSARELAMHFNQTHELPSRMMLSRERVGSVLFYLDPDLRAQLQPGQIANLDVGDPLPQPPMGTNEWIAIPERHVPSGAPGDFDSGSRAVSESRRLPAIQAQRPRTARLGWPRLRYPVEIIRLR